MKTIVDYNNPKTSDRRSNTIRLLDGADVIAAEYINEALNYIPNLDSAKVQLIQHLLDDYQNLCHYRSYTGCLLATEHIEKYKDDPDFFRIQFGDEKEVIEQEKSVDDLAK